MTQKSPKYDLADVRRVANDLRRITLSPKADTDSKALEYSLEDIAACINQLSASDFHRTHAYKNDPGTSIPMLYDDAYITTFQLPDQSKPDELYIKFRLSIGDQLFIDSFHLPR